MPEPREPEHPLERLYVGWAAFRINLHRSLGLPLPRNVELWEQLEPLPPRRWLRRG